MRAGSSFGTLTHTGTAAPCMPQFRQSLAQLVQQSRPWLLLQPGLAPGSMLAPATARCQRSSCHRDLALTTQQLKLARSSVVHHELCRRHADSKPGLQTKLRWQPAGNDAWPGSSPACPARHRSLQPALRIGAASLHASPSCRAARMLAGTSGQPQAFPCSQPASFLPSRHCLLGTSCWAADQLSRHVPAASLHAPHPHQAALVFALRLNLVPHAVHLSTGEGHHAVPAAGMPQV